MQPWESPQWREWPFQLREMIRDKDSLQKWMQSLGRDPQQLSLDSTLFDQLTHSYQMGITPYYLSLIDDFNLDDPLFAQVIPDPRELQVSKEELIDPIGDEAPLRGSRPNRVVVHRYPDRILFLPTSLCGVYCRFCFRKRLVGKPEEIPDREQVEEGIRYIQTHPEIREVIFTGGDPLVLSDERLLGLASRVAEIPHVRLLRIHSRMPVVNPFRLTNELGKALRSLSKPLWMVTHFNHPRELTEVARNWIGGWIDLGLPFLNQTVLLQGINARVEILEELFLNLLETRIHPYYLHQADLVQGTSHLRTTIPHGLKILRELQGRIPGHALPHYVIDQPGGAGKIPLQNPYDLPPLQGSGGG